MARPRGGPTPAATFTRQGGPRPTAFTRHRGGPPSGASVQRQLRQQQRAASRPAIQGRQNVRQQRAAERAARRVERQRATSTPNVVQPGRNPNFAVQPVAPSGRGANRGTQTAVRGGRLRNPAFANPSARDPAARALARTTFRGRFTEQGARFADRRGRSHPAVVGWVGPLFWPYAYNDFIDYTFYPYAYDTFWPSAYEEVYEDVFGPYAFDGTAYANAPSSGRRTRTSRRQSTASVAQVCSDQAPTLTEWPIERIAGAVQPNETQRAALEELKAAAARAIELLKSACPTELPSTPTGRLAAMRQRIETMLQAVQIVRPALEKFYASLNDEQKARFDALNPDEQRSRQARSNEQRQPDVTQVCTGQAAAGDLPTTRIEQALHPTDAQRAALEELKDASLKAADILKANCPHDQTLTASGRVQAMEQRLQAMLQALNTVQPALEKFYSSLNDEQRARFNQLGTRQG
jgi:hypothetical protein